MLTAFVRPQVNLKLLNDIKNKFPVSVRGGCGNTFSFIK